MRCVRKLAFTVLAAVVGSPAYAATLSSETFSYPNGNLVGNGGWAAHSGAGSNPVQVASGQAVLASGAGSREDVNLPSGSDMLAGETRYAGFDVAVSGGDGTSQDYFAHFLDGTSNFNARLFVAAPNVAGSGYTFAIAGSNETPPTKWATDLSFGTTYKVVIAYTFNSSTDIVAKLWVNPVNEASTSVTKTHNANGNASESFGLRQGATAGIGTQTLDNLRVATTFSEALVPEPSAVGLALISLIGLASQRRRRG